MIAAPGEVLLLEQEVWFDTFQYGSDVAVAGGQIQIQRSSDSLYWDGAGWVGTAEQVATTVDVSGLFHAYTFTVGSDGESYVVRLRVHSDPATEAVFPVLVRAAAVELEPTLDPVGFATGLPFTVRVV